MLRTLVLALLILPPALQRAVTLLGSGQVRRFLAETPAFRGPEDLDRLRRVARIQMYAALAIIPLAALPVLALVVGLATGALAPRESLLLLGLGLVMLVQGKLTGRLEKRIDQLPAATPDLAAQRDHILRVWRQKALPDW